MKGAAAKKRSVQPGDENTPGAEIARRFGLSLVWDGAETRVAGKAFLEGDYKKALAACERTIAAKPDYSRVRVLRGAILYSDDRFDEALAAFDDAIRIEPDFSPPYVFRADILLRHGRLDEAIAACDHSIAIDPHSWMARGYRGDALAQLGRVDEALADYNTVIELADDKSAAIAQLRRVNLLNSILTERYNKDMGDGEDDLGELVALARNIPREWRPAAKKLLQDLATNAGRETAGRATATPCLDDAAEETTVPQVPVPTGPRLVTADELFGNVPPTQRAKPRQKYKFPPELLDDPDAVSRAQSVANARWYKIREGHEISPDEDARGKMAASFVKQAQRRQQRCSQPSTG
jgi:predicted negative regulator of RcsB-dependent stress response